MRWLRFAGLAVTLVAVYFSQSIFDHNLSQLFPTWLLDAYPPLYQFTRWLPSDLFELALWVVALAAIGFGLLTPQWRVPPDPHADQAVLPLRPASLQSSREWLGFICMLLALASAVVNLAYLWRTGSDSRQVQIAWAGALLIYLVGNLPVKANYAFRTPWSRADRRALDSENPTNRPVRYWFALGLICLVTVLLWAWPVRGIQLAIDEQVAQIGLHAMTIAQGVDVRLFEGGRNGIPQLAFVPAAIAIRLTGDPLLGLRVTGLCSSLFMILATWLLGCELFRRPALLGYFGEVIEDDGQWIALLAATLVALNVAVFYFSRLPVYLEPLGWGCIGGWALLRGLRTGDRLAYALSGVLTGLVTLLYSSGLTFLLTMPLWWIGAWLLRRTQAQRPVHGFGRANWSAFFVWLGGIFVVIAPVGGLWLRLPSLFLARFQALQLDHLGAAVGVLNHGPALGWFNPNTPVGYPTHWLGSILAPLFLLAIGALLFNADRLPGLLLLLWLAIGVMVGSSFAISQPNAVNLLPILPAIALAIAFTLDRIRLTLLATLGTWLVQATTYVALGVVLWAGLSSWIYAYQGIQLSGNAANNSGYAVRALGANELAVLWVGQQNSGVNWHTPALEFLTTNTPSARSQLTLTPDHWLPTLPLHSTVLVQPEDYASLAAIATHYPGGVLTTQRDLRGNPMLYLYVSP